MQYLVQSAPLLCSETGTLFAKNYCYALRCPDGTEFWLEMDRIPTHLIDQTVRIEGRLYRPDLVSVERIGPA